MQARNETCERLARALEEHSAPAFMILGARGGAYDDTCPRLQHRKSTW